MTDEELKNYLKAGEAVRRALCRAEEIVRPGKRVEDICNVLENIVLESGAKPAFPVNVSINYVAAHYTAEPDDPTVIPDEGVVKVDVGAHVDGCIADAAISIALSEEYESLVQASISALKRALEYIKPGVRLGEVGRVIEEEVHRWGYKPIKNLSGHLIGKYQLHAGKVVPNVGDVFYLDRVRAGEVYAVEPFVTNGAGKVIEGTDVTIFRVISLKRIKKKRKLTELLRSLWREYRSLPFCKRWLVRYLEKSPDEVSHMLEELMEHRAVYGYPALIESKRGFVSQAEDTVIVLEHELVNLTRVSEVFG